MFRRATSDESYELSRFTELELLQGAKDETRELEKIGNSGPLTLPQCCAEVWGLGKKWTSNSPFRSCSLDLGAISREANLITCSLNINCSCVKENSMVLYFPLWSGVLAPLRNTSRIPLATLSFWAVSLNLWSTKTIAETKVSNAPRKI